MSRRHLLSVRLRGPALAVASVCWLGAVALGRYVRGGRGPTWWDGPLMRDVHATIGPPGRLAAMLMSPSDPPVVYTLIALLAAIGLASRRWEIAAVAVVAPGLATAVTDFVLKPLFDRRYTGNLSYPSGHTVAAVAVLTVGVLTVASVRGRILALVVWLAVTASVATGLVGMDYHYPTDTLGGLAVAVGTVLPCAVLADVVVARSRRRVQVSAAAQR